VTDCVSVCVCGPTMEHLNTCLYMTSMGVASGRGQCCTLPSYVMNCPWDYCGIGKIINRLDGCFTDKSAAKHVEVHLALHNGSA